MKRTLLVMLALALILAAPAFADGDFTVWVQSDSEDVSRFPMIEMISEATGIYPDFIEISPAAASERMSLMWASDDMPDVVTGGLPSLSAIEQYAPYGAVMAWNDLIEQYMPNFQTYMNPEVIESIRFADGNIYYIPSIYNNCLEKGLYINQEWLDKLNLEMPNTPEEFYQVLVAFRDQDPNGNGLQDEIPFSGEHIWGDGLDSLEGLFGAFGRPNGFQVEDGQVIYANVMDSCKEGTKFLRRLYTEGLIDKEYFTQDITSFCAKAQSDPSTLGCFISFVAAADSRCLTVEKWMSGEYAYLLPLQNEEGVRVYQDVQYTVSNCQLFMTSSCENPETVAKWVDYMLDPEISMQIDQAPLGIGWTVDEDGAWWQVVEGPEGYDSTAAWTSVNHLQQLPRAMDAYAKEAKGLVLMDPVGSINEDYHQRDAYYRQYCEFQEILPQVTSTQEESEILNEYLPDIEKYYKETLANWITGNGDIDAEWDAYVERMSDLGLDEVLAVYQAQYERTK